MTPAIRHTKNAVCDVCKSGEKVNVYYINFSFGFVGERVCEECMSEDDMDEYANDLHRFFGGVSKWGYSPPQIQNYVKARQVAF